MGHPDDDVQSKYKLLLQALELLVGGPRTIVPAGIEAAIWVDFCCIDQRAGPSQVANTWLRREDWRWWATALP
jgi:hypothetical protein